MTMLATPVALHDVDDIEAFVHATLNSSGIQFEPEERDELVLEGITIMCQLADGYRHQLVGYAQAGRFSGYAAGLLPKRLGDAWHRLHENHIYITRADGSREWVYLQQSISFDGLRARSTTDGHGDALEQRLVSREKWTAVPRASGEPVPAAAVAAAGRTGA